MTSKTARQRRLAAKSSRKKRALRGPFCVWLSGGFRRAVCLTTVKFITLAKPFTMLFIHIADNSLKINWLALRVHSGETPRQKIKILH